MGITLFNTENLPEGCIVKETFVMIQAAGTAYVPIKGIARGILQRNRNEYQEVIDSFVDNARIKTNAILGVQVSTSS
ncbi:hypothetical protein B5G52_07950 [Pseudoalteromonas sp. A601]|uniref:hypothetical protein n=1 Tax=Pseudoalteromonas sp. A601 TaxID=1967839 RepID=UPI000B3D3147|nr:hypothetical protein [Pseudoalteromonas sp. A601]OUS72643.1 hypothetical protein B5G52_07950 [Pseudoalteromonas sp. A601]